jgi:uncharacterized protein (DUF779 family)
MCYPAGEFRTGGSDVLLGEAEVGSGFSLETTENKRFLTRSRVFTDAEWERLKDSKLPTGLEKAAI